MIKTLITVALVVSLAAAGTAYGLGIINPRQAEITRFHPAHTHDAAGTHGAPQHSGGTDRFGCHNASVPYHCH